MRGSRTLALFPGGKAWQGDTEGCQRQTNAVVHRQKEMVEVFNTHAHTYTNTHTCMHNAHKHMHTHTHACTHILTYKPSHMHTNAHTIHMNTHTQMEVVMFSHSEMPSFFTLIYSNSVSGANLLYKPESSHANNLNGENLIKRIIN